MEESIQDLIGKRLESINFSSETVEFETADRKNYRMYHLQDCCESVSMVGTDGNINDILYSKILNVTEEVFSNTVPSWIKDEDIPYIPCADDSYTWTIYTIETSKGKFRIDWLGTSNEYYSESVYFSEY